MGGKYKPFFLCALVARRDTSGTGTYEKDQDIWESAEEKTVDQTLDNGMRGARMKKVVSMLEWCIDFGQVVSYFSIKYCIPSCSSWDLPESIATFTPKNQFIKQFIMYVSKHK